MRWSQHMYVKYKKKVICKYAEWSWIKVLAEQRTFFKNSVAGLQYSKGKILFSDYHSLAIEINF